MHCSRNLCSLPVYRITLQAPAVGQHTKRKDDHPMASITKAEFVSLLDAAEITERQRAALHAHFEKRHPEAHGAFLTWLGLDAHEVRKIREASR